MTAPAGHVTVVVAPAKAPELHAVEYSCPGEGVTDGLAGREADTERLADVETVAAALSPGVLDTDGEAARDRDSDGLADALTILHCT
jgi:hypothetical protein